MVIKLAVYRDGRLTCRSSVVPNFCATRPGSSSGPARQAGAARVDFEPPIVWKRLDTHLTSSFEHPRGEEPDWPFVWGTS